MRRTYSKSLNFAGGVSAAAAVSRSAGAMRSGCNVVVRKLRSSWHCVTSLFRYGSEPSSRRERSKLLRRWKARESCTADTTDRICRLMYSRCMRSCRQESTQLQTHDIVWLAPVAHGEQVQRGFEDKRCPCAAAQDRPRSVVVLRKDGDERLRDAHHVRERVLVVVSAGPLAKSGWRVRTRRTRACRRW